MCGRKISPLRKLHASHPSIDLNDHTARNRDYYILGKIMEQRFMFDVLQVKFLIIAIIEFLCFY